MKSMYPRLILCAFALVLLAVGGAGAGVPWHPYPPGGEVKSLPSPRDPGDFITEAYRRVLGRDPGRAERDRWTRRLEADGEARDGVFLGLLESHEFFIGQCFLALLGRPPGEGELRLRLEFLQGGGDRRDVVRNLLESEEYRSTALPRGR
jgi:hypothetical protein